jgi:hypothetical protein
MCDRERRCERVLGRRIVRPIAAACRGLADRKSGAECEAERFTHSGSDAIAIAIAIANGNDRIVGYRLANARIQFRADG